MSSIENGDNDYDDYGDDDNDNHGDDDNDDGGSGRMEWCNLGSDDSVGGRSSCSSRQTSSPTTTHEHVAFWYFVYLSPHL